MNEYHAAVGLAALDDWTNARKMYLRVAACYRRTMQKVGFADRLFTPPDIGMTYVIFECRSSTEAACVQHVLRRDKIDWRLCYGHGLQTEGYFANFPQERLHITTELMPSLLGLPMAPDLTDEQIAGVVACISAAVLGSD
jgi:dTDP-4-amino-4,6-dideoxygalactose transaminase